MLSLIGAAGAAGLLAACADPKAVSVVVDSTTAATTTAATAGAAIPSETGGPFPADGTNGPNVLTDGAVVRRDLTTSFGDMSGTADGAPTRINLTLVEAATGSPIPGAAVYLWHCTADGQYSIYEVRDQNYLRGIQVADDAGRITFDTIFPGCYGGRWPHCHFEIFSSLDEATGGSRPMKTSQLALPEADCAAVYADSAYGSSANNLSRLSLSSDMVFSDGWTDQLATVVAAADGAFDVNLLVRV